MISLSFGRPPSACQASTITLCSVQLISYPGEQRIRNEQVIGSNPIAGSIAGIPEKLVKLRRISESS